jgi:tetratricopeptide (TPR) repeat protein
MNKPHLVALLAIGLLAAPPTILAQVTDEEQPTQPQAQQEVKQSPAELLDRLFGQLHQAKDERAAGVIEQAIWRLWSHSGSPTADALLGQAEKAIGGRRYGVAISILNTVVEQHPDFSEAWNRRATAFYLDRQFDRSLADIDRVLALEPRHFGALSGLGLIRRAKGDFRGALEAFRRALAIYPLMPSAQRAVKELQSELEQAI